MRIKSEDTLGLIIDYQEKLIPVINNHKELVNSSKILIEGLNILDVPMIVTEQYKKGLGETIGEIKSVLENIQHSTHDKLAFSCGDDEEIIKAIKSYGKKSIIICGIETHICVLQSVIDLIQLGYQVILVTDCTSSRKETDKEVGLKRAEKEGAILTTYESILFELTRRAGNNTFKAISKLIR